MKKFIVIGSGYSGSSALFDYLRGRGDIEDPFNSREFRLTHDPCGLHELYNSIYNNYSLQLANSNIEYFEKNAFRMYGNKYDFANGYINKKEYIKDFVEKITSIKYKGIPGYKFKEININKRVLLKLINLLVRYIKNRPIKYYTIRIPVDEDIYINESVKLIDKIINDVMSSHCDNIAINQGGSFWNPVSTTKYFGDRKIIIVTRDPKDIYAEMQYNGGSYPKEDVNKFISFYNLITSKINKKEWNNKSFVMKIRFEEFVYNYELNKKNIDNFLGIDNKHSSYCPYKSMQNIGIYNKILNENEIKKINKYANII